LQINEGIELLAGDTQLAPGLAQTNFSASESDLAHFDRRLRDLRADALCHRPAILGFGFSALVATVIFEHPRGAPDDHRMGAPTANVRSGRSRRRAR
jgi:hypothetical protein